jgi:4-hydroxy-tetrahydrodipicolinate synthase
MKIHGIIPAMVTPLDSSGEINVAALRRLVDFLIDGGVHGLFANGGQGEFWAFTDTEKRMILEVVVDQVAGRVPVYAGTGAITTREAIALTRDAQSIGVSAVSVLTPFYVVPTAAELYEHYRAVAGATCLPVLIYTNPSKTGVPFPPDLLSRLVQIDTIAGIKDSSGDLSLTLEYLRRTDRSFAVLIGMDTLICAGIISGAAGAIAATANVVPKLVVEIYTRLQAGDIAGAKRAQERLAPLRQAFSWGTFPVVVKEALDLMGLEAGPARLPVRPIDGSQRERLRALLVEMGVI